MQKALEKQEHERVEECSSFSPKNPSNTNLFDQVNSLGSNKADESNVKILKNSVENSSNDGNINTDSFHERKLRYEQTTARIFKESFVSRKIKKCRERYKKRRAFARIVETTVLDEVRDNRPYAKINLGTVELFGLLDSGASKSVLGKGSVELLTKLQ